MTFAIALGVAALSVTACGSEQDDTTAPVAATRSTESPLSPSSSVVASSTEAPDQFTGSPAAPTSPAVDPYAGMPLIDHAAWTEAIDGPRLMIFPTQAGRDTTFPGALDRAWQEVLAGSAEAEAPGMFDQFRCHWEWARVVRPNKPSWNLEPWRPAVGYQETVNALCNPGGPER